MNVMDKIHISGAFFQNETVCLTLFVAPGRIAIMDVVYDATVAGGGWIITRINVPERERGNGYGSALLKRFLELADHFQKTVSLGVSSSNPKFTNGKLREWYKRHGFIREKGAPTNALIRFPQTPTP
jgi:GNAT superfamily N-acetyltransferase